MEKLYSDEQLIGLLASTESRRVDTALTQLHRQHRDMVFRLVRQNSGTLQDAEEVFDDVMVGLWGAVRAGRYQPTARLKTYLYQVARNLWFRRLRDAGRGIRLTDTESFDGDPVAGVDEAYEQNEAIDAYWAKLQAIGETCYNVVRAFSEGYTMQEIADRFGLGTANNAKTIKYNCLKKAGKPTS